MFEEETCGFFERFYRISSSKKAVKMGAARKLEDFCRNHYFFKVKTFLPPRITIKDRETKILDLGCGDGNYLFSLIDEKMKGSYFGVDISKEAIKKAKETLSIKSEIFVKSKEISIDLSVQNARTVNFKNDFFDYVYIVSILHHIERYDQVLEETKRILKKGGKLIIVDSPKDGLIPTIGRKIIKYLPKKVKALLFEDDLLLEDEFPTRSKVTRRLVKNNLIKNNFDIEEEGCFYLYFHYLVYLYKLFPWLFILLLPFNIILIFAESKIKSIFKNNCGLYTFVFIKK